MSRSIFYFLFLYNKEILQLLFDRVVALSSQTFKILHWTVYRPAGGGGAVPSRHVFAPLGQLHAPPQVHNEPVVRFSPALYDTPVMSKQLYFMKQGWWVVTPLVVVKLVVP